MAAWRESKRDPCSPLSAWLCTTPVSFCLLSLFSLLNILPAVPVTETFVTACRAVKFLDVSILPVECSMLSPIWILEINGDECLPLTHSCDLHGCDQSPAKQGSRKEYLLFRLSQTGHLFLALTVLLLRNGFGPNM